MFIEKIGVIELLTDVSSRRASFDCFRICLLCIPGKINSKPWSMTSNLQANWILRGCIVAIYRTKTGFTVLTNKHKSAGRCRREINPRKRDLLSSISSSTTDAVARKHVGKIVTNPSATTKTKASKASKASSSDDNIKEEGACCLSSILFVSY